MCWSLLWCGAWMKKKAGDAIFAWEFPQLYTWTARGASCKEVRQRTTVYALELVEPSSHGPISPSTRAFDCRPPGSPRSSVDNRRGGVTWVAPHQLSWPTTCGSALSSATAPGSSPPAVAARVHDRVISISHTCSIVLSRSSAAQRRQLGLAPMANQLGRVPANRSRRNVASAALGRPPLPL
jgi:hypothetical protein